MTIKLIYKIYERELNLINQQKFCFKYESNTIISLISKTISLMQKCIQLHGFMSLEEEISFFKHIKPEIASELKFIKYQKKHIIKYSYCTEDDAIEFLKKQIKKRKKCLIKCNFLVEYLAEDHTHNDINWFTRSNIDPTSSIVPHTSILQEDFSTMLDNSVTKIKFNQKIIADYQNKIENPVSLNYYNENNTTVNKLKWTGSKSDFTEIVYALAKSNALDHGNVKISDIAKNLENIFLIFFFMKKCFFR